MLRRIQLKNFKLHADTSIEAAPITVFIGPNSSGKSSIFQALLLWRQGAARNSPHLFTFPARLVTTKRQPYLFPADQMIDIGEFDQVVTFGEHEISIDIFGNVPQGKAIEYGPGATDAHLQIGVRENQIVYHAGDLDYRIDALAVEGHVGWVWPPTVLRAVNATGEQKIRESGAAIKLIPSSTLSMLERSELHWTSSSLPQAEQVSFLQFGQRAAEAPKRLLSSIHAVFPLRGLEESGYPLADEPAENLDRMALQDRTIALLSVLAYNRDVERRISAWLADLASIRIETKLLPGKRVTILCGPAGELSQGSLFSNEGTGATQLPFILVPIGLTPPGETVFLSEPEVHLHPRYQSELTRLLVNLTRSEKRQFFIETHSEHVLHSLLNLVAKGDLSTSDLAIYYFEKKNGKAACERLQIDVRGGVAGGLPGFFDQSLGELAEYLGASQPK